MLPQNTMGPWGKILNSLELFCVAVFYLLIVLLLAVVLACCLMPQQASFFLVHMNEDVTETLTDLR